jgi:NifU-like protein
MIQDIEVIVKGGVFMHGYIKKMKDHFLKPRNVGEIENPDGSGEAGSVAVGDAVRITFKLDDNRRIKDIQFKAFGGMSVIASTSALTEIVKGMTLEEAEKVTNLNIANYLGVPPEEKMYYSKMGREALEAAIVNSRGQKKKKEDFEVVCKSYGVTDGDIIRAIRENDLKTVEQVTYYTKAGGGSAKCHPEIEAIIQKVRKDVEKEAPPARPKKRLTIIQKIKLIEETLGREIIPALRAQKGDLELIDIKGNTVYVALRGSCSFCHGSEFTIKHYVQAKLKEFVEDEIMVEEIRP